MSNDHIFSQAVEIERLRKALEELADLMDDVRSGNYKPDSFTTQTARELLARDKEQSR